MVHGGTFTLNGKTAIALGLPLAPLSADSAKSWVQVIPGEGSFEGHADGPFEFNGEVIDSIIANADKRETPIKFDYEHDTHNDMATGPKPASGKVLDLDKREGDQGAELWAFVEWTNNAARMIRENEYNFNSPVIAFEWPDAATGDDQGPTLLSVALTDVPFLDGQEAIQLTWKGKKRMDQLKLSAVEALDKAKEKLQEATRDAFKEILDEVAEGGVEMAGHVDEEEVRLQEGATEKEELRGVDEVKLQEETEEVELQEPEVELQEETEVNGNVFLDSLADMTGLDKAAALALLMDNLDAIAALINREADVDGTVSEARQMSQDQAVLKEGADAATISKLTQKIETLERKESRRSDDDKTTKATAIAARVDGLIAETYVRSEDRETAIRLFTNDPKAAEQIFKHKVVPIGESQTGEGSTSTTTTGTIEMDSLSDDVQALARQMIQAKIRGGDKQKCIALAIEKKGN